VVDVCSFKWASSSVALCGAETWTLRKLFQQINKNFVILQNIPNNPLNIVGIFVPAIDNTGVISMSYQMKFIPPSTSFSQVRVVRNMKNYFRSSSLGKKVR
jgi:hypothetical protein